MKDIIKVSSIYTLFQGCFWLDNKEVIYVETNPVTKYKNKKVSLLLLFILLYGFQFFTSYVLFTDYRDIIIVIIIIFVHKELFTLRSFCGIIFSLTLSFRYLLLHAKL